MNGEGVFRYSYSARYNEEVQAIRSKYLPKRESRPEELKRLDRRVKTAGTAQALALGIVGCLIFGFGMCLAIQVIGSSIAPGAFVGAWGIAIMAAAYPVQRSFFRKTKAKHQARIPEPATELCGDDIKN